MYQNLLSEGLTFIVIFNAVHDVMRESKECSLSRSMY